MNQFLKINAEINRKIQQVEKDLYLGGNYKLSEMDGEDLMELETWEMLGHTTREKQIGDKLFWFDLVIEEEN